MTTINTIHDLHRILVDHPEWRDELRRILLTEELLALPQRFAEYTKVTDGKLDALTGEVRGLTNHAESTDEKLDALFRETRQNTNHIGEVKGMFMERIAREDGGIIASDMGLQWRKTLDRSEVAQIADRARLSGAAADIPRDYMRAFVRADLIFEATDRSGNETYVAVEISYTADERDVIRATRHAEYLTRFTGTPAYAAIASVHTDNRIADIMTEGTPQSHDSAPETKVFWSRLPEMEPAN
ncbi:MAG: hypothetical protein F4Y49_01480 [Dehalococcoidia bacterium]|nr:hypothetical protein [Dehalococcoidia bacterium]